MEATIRLLKTRFPASYQPRRANTGLSALALMRQLGVSYPAAWRIHDKLMTGMTERENRYYVSHRRVEVDDASLGGEHSGGMAARGSEHKVPFVAAVWSNDDAHPLRVKLTPVAVFAFQALKAWSCLPLAPGCIVTSDGLAYLTAVTTAGCVHERTVVGGRKPKALPEFQWVKTVLGNLKRSLSGTFHAFRFSKYAARYLGALPFRFNRRFRLATLPQSVLIAAVHCRRRTELAPRCAERS